MMELSTRAPHRGRPPWVVGSASLALRTVEARTLAVATRHPSSPFAGRALLGTERVTGGVSVRAVPDGNRAATLPSSVADAFIAGRAYTWSIKGVGAGGPLYGDGPLSGLEGRPEVRPVVRESWMGESPFGGQSEKNALAALALTELSVEARLFGMFICPVVAVVAIPESAVTPGHHYRRFDEPIAQEHRLVPSNVRLFHGTGPGLGQAPQRFLNELDLVHRDALYAFSELLLSSGLAALTVFARSLEERAGRLVGLDFDDAWLDKDAVVAPDGALHFVDLESLDWVAVRDGDEAQARIRRQLARNVYDLFFAVDALLRAHEILTDDVLGDARRRNLVAELTALSLDRQPSASPVGFERDGGALRLVLAPSVLAGTPHAETHFSLIDTR